MEETSAIPVGVELTPVVVVNLWLDEYFLRLKFKSFEEDVADSPVNELVAAFLMNRKGCENEHSLLLRWLHFISNPRFFFEDGRGQPAPILQKALYLGRSVTKVIGCYSKDLESHDLMRFLEDIRKHLEISTLAVCCDEGRFKLATDIFEAMNPGDHIPANLLTCMRGQTTYDITNDLDNLKRSVRIFIEELKRILPEPALVTMAENLLATGECQSDKEEDGQRQDVDIPYFNIRSCLSNHFMELDEVSKRLSNQKPMLENKLKELNVRERLKVIHEASCDSSVIQQHKNNKHKRIDDDPKNNNNNKRKADINDDKNNSDDDDDSNESLLITRKSRKKKMNKKKRISNGDTGGGDNDDDEAVTKVGTKTKDDEPQCNNNNSNITDNITLPPNQKLIENLDFEIDDKLPPTLDAFKTSTQKYQDKPSTSSTYLSERLTRPPLSQVPGVSPIRSSPPSSKVDGKERIEDDRSVSSNQSTEQSESLKNRILLDNTNPLITPCITLVEKLPWSSTPALTSLTPAKNTRSNVAEEPKKRKLFTEKMPLFINQETPAGHEISYLRKDLRKGQLKNKDIFADNYQNQKGNLKMKKTNESDLENSTKKKQVAAITPPRKGIKDSGDDDDDDDSDFDAIGGNKKGRIKQISRKSSEASSPLFESPKKRGTKRSRGRWTDREEQLFYKLVQQFGEGRWAEILSTGSFPNRTNVNLKDKWRNMISSGIVDKLKKGLRVSPLLL